MSHLWKCLNGFRLKINELYFISLIYNSINILILYRIFLCSSLNILAITFCESCGNKVSDSSKFCGNCGTKISNAKKEGNPQRIQVQNPVITNEWKSNIKGSIPAPSKNSLSPTIFDHITIKNDLQNDSKIESIVLETKISNTFSSTSGYL